MDMVSWLYGSYIEANVVVVIEFELIVFLYFFFARTLLTYLKIKKKRKKKKTIFYCVLTISLSFSNGTYHPVTGNSFN